MTLADMLPLLESWPAFVLALVVFGLAPGLALRLIVLMFAPDDPRRRELLAELHVVPRWERPFWVVEQLEVAACEGLWNRFVWALTGRVIYRWKLGSGVKANLKYPSSFHIPSADEKSAVRPGDLVKLMFRMRDGWGERMWVCVEKTDGDKFVGSLNNDPYAIPRLYYGAQIKFRSEHIIDITEPEFIDGVVVHDDLRDDGPGFVHDHCCGRVELDGGPEAVA